jgi:hypothetical protein
MYALNIWYVCVYTQGSHANGEKSVNSVYTFHGLEKSLNFTEILKIGGKIGYFIAGQGSFVVPTSDSAERLM